MSRRSIGSIALVAASLALGARAESVRYQLVPGDDFDRAVSVGGGFAFGIPGNLGLEAFGTSVNSDFLPNLYADARILLAAGFAPGSYTSDHIGNLNNVLGISAKVGLATNFWLYGTTNVSLGDTETLMDVPSAQAWALAAFVGLETLAHDWRPLTGTGTQLGFTPTLMGGIHGERTVDLTVAPEGRARAAKSERLSMDLSATYGIFGPRQGLGFLLQARYSSSQFQLFGLDLYGGAELGSIFLNPNPDVVNLTTAQGLDVFTATVRFGAVVGLVWNLKGHSRLPKLDPECVKEKEKIDGCELYKPAAESPPATAPATPPAAAPPATPPATVAPPAAAPATPDAGTPPPPPPAP